MVGWYDPLQLLATARQTILADIFGGRADFRLHQQGRGGNDALDYRQAADSDGALWIDYVADMGDGFDATFSVARMLAAPALEVTPFERPGGPPAGGSPLHLPRGQLLLMGGDQVYPTPDDESYLQRLVDPFELALPARPTAESATMPLPHVLAIPGNHDWYDGLQSFVKVFCRRTRVGGWATPQSRSYFAARLPHRFWLFGLDTQLNGDLDETQLGYFAGQPIEAGDQVVICLPEPQWMRVNTFEGSARLPNNIVRLLDHLADHGAEVPLQLAGDTHHYRRHSQPSTAVAGATGDPSSGPQHLVTSGGGGAFLHPTHTRPRAARCCYNGQLGLRRLLCKLTLCRASDQPARCLGVRFGRPSTPDRPAPLFELAAEYPSARLSWSRTLGNWAFILHNPRFGLMTAALYLCLAWLMPAPRLLPEEGGGGWLRSLTAISLRGLSDLTAAPARLLLFVLVLLAFWAFTGTHRRLFRVLAATSHGGAHLLAALLITLAAQDYLRPVPGSLTRLGLSQPLVVMVHRLAEWTAIAAGGYLAGAVLMGLYLLITCGVFGRHSNEAFSALRIADHKHVLRMRLDRQGMTIFVLALDRVSRFRAPRGQRLDADGLVEACRASAPRIIDQFVVRPRARSVGPG